MDRWQIILPALGALLLTAAATPLLMRALVRIRAEQTVRDDGPQTHLAKSGTPTMGGLAILGAVAFASLAVAGPDRDMAAILIVFALFGLLGFLDDFVKVARRRSLGLTARQKLLLQTLIAAGFGLYQAWIAGTGIAVPFTNSSLDLGWLFVPFVVFVVVAMANAVNLTDGLDGLASGVTLVVAAFFAFAAWRFGTPAAGIFAAALAGACLGFLFFNRYPARIFMGDTGSMALGGGLAAAAIQMDAALLLPIAGAVYVAEALSVLLQVGHFKKTGGRRLLRMAPLHHHFELGGWKETKVAAVFWLVTLVLCLGAGIGIALQ